MHILVLNWQDRKHPQSGGAEVHLHEIFGRIAEQGHQVTLFCCRFDGAPATEILDGIQVIRRGSRSSFNYHVPLWWRTQGKALQPDIVIDDINKLPFYTPLFVKKPVLGIIHHFFGDTIFNEVGTLAGAYVKLFEDRISRIYRNTPISVVSESTRQECIDRGLSPENLHTIHNAIDHTKYPMKIMAKADVPTIVYMGRLKKYKSVDHIIKAIKLLLPTVPNVRLEILGTGDEKPELESLVESLGLTQHVTFHGFVSDADKVEWLSKAHVVVNSSIKEGWGITNIESNACGTPIVSADVPGLRDSVREGLSGRLYPYGDIECMSRLIQRILIDPEERKTLTDGALRWASTFTWERSAREMLELCTRVIDTSKYSQR